MSSQADKQREELLQAATKRLQESGERERLKALFLQKLIESGWHDDMKAQIKALVSQKGAENVKLDELVNQMTPYGLRSVNVDVKLELLYQIKGYLQANYP